MSVPPVPRPGLASLVLPTLLAVLSAGPAHADDAGDIARLAQSGRGEEALRRVDTALARQPRDAQMRFMKGVMLSESRPAEAIAIFIRLNQDYPRLPEPYNNLAVLYASLGQYEKARDALEKALRTSPAYATAYRNLGDIHARLASQAYDRALQIESAKPGAGARLALVHSLAAPPDQPGMPAAVPAMPAIASAPLKPAVPPAPAAGMLAVAPVEVARDEAPDPGPLNIAGQKLAAGQAGSVPRATARVEAARHPAAGAGAPALRLVKADKPDAAAREAAQEAEAGKDAVLNAVNAWAKAWSAQDVQAYLAHYAQDFNPPKGIPRKVWMEERRARIAGKGHISVAITAPQVSLSGDTATVSFRQVYVSDRLNSNSRKTLQLERQRGKWLITQERTGNG